MLFYIVDERLIIKKKAKNFPRIYLDSNENFSQLLGSA